MLTGEESDEHPMRSAERQTTGYRYRSPPAGARHDPHNVRVPATVAGYTMRPDSR